MWLRHNPAVARSVIKKEVEKVPGGRGEHQGVVEGVLRRWHDAGFPPVE